MQLKGAAMAEVRDARAWARGKKRESPAYAAEMAGCGEDVKRQVQSGYEGGSKTA